MNNKEHFAKQDENVLTWLKSGDTINRIEAIQVGITALNSRISTLRNKHKIIIHDRFIRLPSGVMLKEYSLKEFEK